MVEDEPRTTGRSVRERISMPVPTNTGRRSGIGVGEGGVPKNVWV
jgi:hypothetical protein